jgi:hypothetical protein
MEHEVDGARHKYKVGDVLPDKSEIRIPGQMGDIVWRSGDEIINRDHAKSLSQQPITEMGTQKSGATRHNRGIFRRIRSKHWINLITSLYRS